MNKIYTSILAVTLMLSSVLAVPMAANATDGTYNQAPQGGTTSNGTGGTTNPQNNDNGGFDWRWLLPLIAIPLIYLMTRKRDNNEINRDNRQYPAGAKGGRASKNDDE
jgi:hypothetical protein